MLALLPCTRALKVSSRAWLFNQHIFGRLKAEASICVQAEPANGNKASDLLSKLAGVSSADNHLLEIANRASEVTT